MTKNTEIKRLWDIMVNKYIEQAYAANQATADGDGHSEANALRDFTNGWSHRELWKLLQIEVQHERRHRHAASSGIVHHVPIETGAKLLIMGNIVAGSHMHNMPPATMFITCRDSAAMAILLGYLIRSEVAEEWRQAVKAIDYTKLHSEVR